MRSSNQYQPIMRETRLASIVLKILDAVLAKGLPIGWRKIDCLVHVEAVAES
jgi:hypothetical protein